MATILFGNTGGGAEVNVAFAGNVALSGARLISEGAGDDSLALDYNWPTPAGNDLLLKMEEGAGDSLTDAGPQSYTAYLGNAAGADAQDPAWSSQAWMEDEALSFAPGGGTDAKRVTIESVTTANPGCSVFFWYKRDVAAWKWEHIFQGHVVAGQDQFALQGGTGTAIVRVSSWVDGSGIYSPVIECPFDVIHAVGATAEIGGALRCFVDGSYTENLNMPSGTWNNTQDVLFGQGTTWYCYGLLYGLYYAPDKVLSIAQMQALSKRYVQGSAIIQYNFGGAQNLTNIAWNATETGDWEGDISKIEVYDQDGASWTQVGGASPTSPIDLSGSPVTIGSAALADIIRVTVDPKADTLQSETAKLLDMTLTHSAAAGGFASPFGGTLIRGSASVGHGRGGLIRRVA